MNDLQWTCQHFHDLDVHVLYNILKLRGEVFIVEQNCIYQDLDDKDQNCFHLCGWFEGTIVAYARIIPPGIIYHEASIGRVVTSLAYRKKGAGRMLMTKAIDKTKKLFRVSAIKIGAQFYLHNFYTSLGFTQVSDQYIEDGIPHIKMLLPA